MGAKTFLCGNSSTIKSQSPPDENRPDRGPPKILTKMHVASWECLTQGFRVLAVLENGDTCPICLGETREDALKQVWERKREIPRRAVQLRLEAWIGSLRGGTWRRLPCQRHELPTPPARRRPRPNRRRVTK